MKTLFHLASAAVALLLGSSTATAQLNIGPRLGFNLTTVDYSLGSNYSPTLKNKAGFQAGVAANIPLNTNFAFQPSLLYSQKGFQYEETRLFYYGRTNQIFIDYDLTASYNYLELPLNFVFTTDGEKGLQLLAGPYVACGVGGNIDSQARSQPPSGPQHSVERVKFISQASSDGYSSVQRFDAGFTGGLGYRRGPFQVQASYMLGLGTLSKEEQYTLTGDFEWNKLRNRGFQLAATYFFSLQ